MTGDVNRPGPVHVDVPLNVFVEPVEAQAIEREADWPQARWARPAGDPRAIAEAARLLAAAERPVIVAGHGIELASAETALAAYAEAKSIPVATTPFGKGVFDARHSLSLGATGRNGPYAANAACRNADGTQTDTINTVELYEVGIDLAAIGRASCRERV